MDALKSWLESQGFKIETNPIPDGRNLETWYAVRPVSIPCRDCEANPGKRKAIAVYPYRLVMGRDVPPYESFEVRLVGEALGVWYQLMAYSLSTDDLSTKLADVERTLVSAWEALVTVDIHA